MASDSHEASLCLCWTRPKTNRLVMSVAGMGCVGADWCRYMQIDTTLWKWTEHRMRQEAGACCIARHTKWRQKPELLKSYWWPKVACKGGKEGPAKERQCVSRSHAVKAKLNTREEHFLLAKIHQWSCKHVSNILFTKIFTHQIQNVL